MTNKSRRTVLEAENLVKSFGRTVAVDQVSLSAREGEILAVLGPNGAGKTTLVEMLAGLRSPAQPFCYPRLPRHRSIFQFMHAAGRARLR